MKLEQQVVSLELAKKLKELGVKQYSLFYWCGNPGIEYKLLSNDGGHRPETGGNDMFCSAFTSSELGEMLPNTVNIYRRELTADVQNFENRGKWFWIVDICTSTARHSVSEDTEADARASMLIYLLQNNLITI